MEKTSSSFKSQVLGEQKLNDRYVGVLLHYCAHCTGEIHLTVNNKFETNRFSELTSPQAIDLTATGILALETTTIDVNK